jgi:hypothetical protein
MSDATCRKRLFFKGEHIMFEDLINMGTTERVLRMAAGIALLGLLALNGPWRWAGLLGLIPLVTGAIGWCPLYTWFTRD